MTIPPSNPDATYSVDMISRSSGELVDSVLRVFDYNRSSTAFVPTDYADGRCEITVKTQGAETFNVFSIEGVEVMTVDDTGVIRAADFSYLAKPSDYPRLEFIRKTSSSVRQVVARLTKTGVLSCYQLREEGIPLSTDQMIFQNGGWIVDDLMASLNLPCYNAGLNSIFSIKNTDFRQTILGGEVGCAYLLDIRFNGRMETRNYYGPNQVQVAGYFIPAPSPPGDEALNQPTNPRNIWRFTISDPEQVFYLNSNQAYVQNLAFDYTITGLRANPGAMIKIEFNAVDGLQLGYQEMSVTLVGYKPADVLISSSDIAGETWTARETNRFWFDVALSDDGTKLVALEQYGHIFTSNDSGVSWTERASVASWFGVASSSDGTKLLASAGNGQLYTSTDSGVTWTARDSNRDWQGVASSSNGTKLVALVDSGQIYTSTDSGVTWTARDSNRDWRYVASSSDGTKLVATVNGGQLYTSTDSGVTWTARDSSRDWRYVASSADGTKLAATVFDGQIYTSTDSGVSWTARESIRPWQGVASSADGTKLLASGYGQLYTSTDSGETWTARESIRAWSGVASSADGTKLAAGVWEGQIYTSYVPSPCFCTVSGDSASAGPKGLLAQGFEATAAGIFETHRVLDPQLRRVLTPSGKYLTYPH